MDRPTHIKFAPIFTLTTSFMLANSTGIAPGVNNLVQIGLATLASNLTAMAPDADLHCYKPLYIIWGKKGNHKVYVKQNNSNHSRVSQAGWNNNRSKQTGRQKRRTTSRRSGGYAEKNYATPKHLSSKIWATLFKFMGTPDHRGFQSHSPILWLPIWAILYFTALYLNKFLGIFIFGMGAGYMSHIVGDLFTKGGVELFPGANFSPIGQTLGRIPILRRLPKANNKIWTTMFLIASVDIALLVIAPSLIKPINAAALAALKQIFYGIRAIFGSHGIPIKGLINGG